jgi:hypothetical protein
MFSFSLSLKRKCEAGLNGTFQSPLAALVASLRVSPPDLRGETNPPKIRLMFVLSAPLARRFVLKYEKGSRCIA